MNPDLKTIYGLVDSGRPRKIMYIGVTGRWPERLGDHLRGREANTKAWVRSVISAGRKVIGKVLEQSETYIPERFHIAKEQPPLNKNWKWLPKNCDKLSAKPMK